LLLTFTLNNPVYNSVKPLILLAKLNCSMNNHMVSLKEESF